MNSYMYLGWAFDRCEGTDAQMILMPFSAETGSAQFWRATSSTMMKFVMPPFDLAAADRDITGVAPDGNGGGDTIYRLREGIERFMITDINDPAAGAFAQSELWIMFDLVPTVAKYFNHVPGGANVLYMDGHVDFIRYPGAQPVNELVAETITAMPHALEF